MWKFSNFSTADPRNASSHWLQPDLDAPGCCLFSDDLILVVLRGDRDVFLGGISFWIFEFLFWIFNIYVPEGGEIDPELELGPELDNITMSYN